jgi:hypothetical protein
VDEPIHFDPVIKYSHGHVPRKMKQISRDIALLVAFLLLIAYGIDRVLDRFGNATKFLTLAVMIFAMLALEVATA